MMDTAEKKYHEILNISADAEAPEIRKAFTKQLINILIDSKSEAAAADWLGEIKQTIEAYEKLSAGIMDPPYSPEEKKYGLALKEPYPKEKETPMPPEQSSEKLTLIKNNDTGPVLEKVNELLPEYFAAKENYAGAKNKLTEATRRKTATTPTVLLWFFIATLLGGTAWALLNFYSKGINPLIPEKKPFEPIEDSTTNAAVDSVAITAVDSSLVERDSSLYIVAEDRAYFYEKPFETTMTENFLLKGSRLTATLKYGSFYYITFENRYNKKTLSGWVRAEDIIRAPK